MDLEFHQLDLRYEALRQCEDVYKRQRWILGTHQGSVAQEHLQAYLEEFTFRFNRRTSRSRGLLFRRLLEQAVATPPITEAHVTHGKHWRPQ